MFPVSRLVRNPTSRVPHAVYSGWIALLCAVATVFASGPSASGMVNATQVTATAPLPLDVVAPVARMGLGEPRDVAWSPNGGTLAVGTTAGVVVADASPDSARLLTTLADWSVSLAWSPDGGRLAVGMAQGGVALVNPVDGTVMETRAAHTRALRAVAWSRDGETIATAGDDGLVKLWSGTALEPLASLKAHTGAVLSVAFAGDSALLASGGADRTIRLWSVPDRAAVTTLEGSAARVTSVAWRPGSRQLASASEDGVVRMWDADGGGEIERVTVYPGNSGGALAWAPGGHQLAVALQARPLTMLSVEPLQVAWRSPDSAQGRPAVTWSGDGRQLATLEFGPPSASIRASDDGVVLHRHAGFLVSPTRVAWQPAGSALAVGQVLNDTVLWRVGEERPFFRLDTERRQSEALAWTADGQFLAVGVTGGRLDLRASDGRLIRSTELRRGYATAAAISPEGDLLAIGTNEGELHLRRIDDLSVALPLSGHTARVHDIAFSPDGRWLASGSEDQTFRLWSTTTGAPIATSQEHRSAVKSVGFSADSQFLASAGIDGRVHVWTTPDASLSGALPPMETTSRIAWSPKETRLAVATRHGIELWRPGTDTAETMLRGHDAVIGEFAWSADGRSVAGAATNGTLIVWRLP